MNLSAQDPKDSRDGEGAELGGGGMRSSQPTPRLFPAPESMRPTLTGSRWMVCGGHPLTAEVAARVFAAGGNAIDAGVAAGLASNVVQVDMCSLGGIAPIVMRLAGRSEAISISGVGLWGSEVTLERFRARFGGTVPLGEGVAVVPAALDAWITALACGGTWSFSQVAAPAIELAESGFPLDQRTAAALTIMGRGFAHWPTSRAVLWPSGAPPQTGEILRQPALARLLTRLAEREQGGRPGGLEAVRAAFYEGEVAQRIVEFVRAGGGWLSLTDLAEFRSEVEVPPAREFAGWKVFSSGPFTQGPALLQALAILEHLEVGRMRHNGADYLHVLVEAIKLAFSDRERFYGDPHHVEVDLEHLLSDAHAAELAARIVMDGVLPNLPTLRSDGKVPPPRAGRLDLRRDTTYLCTLDAAGNAFSATPSDTADGGPIVPELGFLISPRGVQSRLDPSHPAVLGPGRRPRTSPASALALTAAGDVWTFGCPGGDVILQAMLQAFLNHVVFGRTLQQAVEEPRVAGFSFPGSFYPHVEVPGRLSVEARIPPEVREDLAARGHDVELWDPWDFDMGSVGMARSYVGAGRAPRLEAAADPRRTAYAFGA